MVGEDMTWISEKLCDADRYEVTRSDGDPRGRIREGLVQFDALAVPVLYRKESKIGRRDAGLTMT